MRNRRALKLILLVAVCLYFCRVAPLERMAAGRSVVSLRYGQMLALSDLDGDATADQARLKVSGANKTISLRFGRRARRYALRFSTHSSLRGSLLARDIDNDGDIDLIWTDTVHPDEVVVWINDGSGCFRRTPAHGWAADFVFDGDTSARQSRAISEIHPGLLKALSFDAGPSAKLLILRAAARVGNNHTAVRGRAGWSSPSSERAPPFEA